MILDLAKRAPERNGRSNCPLSCNSSIRPRVAITCCRTDAPRVDFRRFADRRDLPRSSCGNTWWGTEGRLNVVRTESLYTPSKSIEICIDCGTTLQQPPPIAINNINDLDAATPRNCKRSVKQDKTPGNRRYPPAPDRTQARSQDGGARLLTIQNKNSRKPMLSCARFLWTPICLQGDRDDEDHETRN